jgi:hypothetical protein
VTVGEAMDSGDKSANKAMSAAMKYALIETFSIPTAEDNDTENQTHQPLPQRAAPPQHAQPKVQLASADQVREVKELLNIVRLKAGLVDEWFARAGVDVWEDMPAETIGKCIAYVRGRLPGASAEQPPPSSRAPAMNVAPADWDAFGDAVVQCAERAGEVDRVTAVLTIIKKQNPTDAQLSAILTAMEKSEFDWQQGRVTTAQQTAA